VTSSWGFSFGVYVDRRAKAQPTQKPGPQRGAVAKTAPIDVPVLTTPRHVVVFGLLRDAKPLARMQALVPRHDEPLHSVRLVLRIPPALSPIKPTPPTVGRLDVPRKPHRHRRLPVRMDGIRCHMDSKA
jgi:hypothetical protein